MVHFKTIKIHVTVTQVAKPTKTDGFLGWIEDSAQDQFRTMKQGLYTFDSLKFSICSPTVIIYSTT